MSELIKKLYVDQAGAEALAAGAKAKAAEAEQNAKNYADSLADNYEAAGNVASAVQSLKDNEIKENSDAIATLNGDSTVAGSVDKKIADAKALIDADVDAVEKKADDNAVAIASINNEETGILAKAKEDATSKANTVQANVDKLTGKVGEVPEGSTVMGIITNIQESAYDDTELRGLISGVQGEVDTLEQTHATDKTALEATIALKADQTALQTEVDRAKGVEGGLETRLATVEGDYLKKSDKDELVADIEENTDAIGVLNGDSSVEGSVDKKVADAINTFATQISDDGTINTYKEILNYISTHGGEASEMAAAIDVLETLVGSKSVATQIAEAINAENLAQYATDEELATAIARIVVLEGKAHKHENAEILEGITSEKVSAWDAAESNAKGYTNAEIAKIDLSGIKTNASAIATLEETHATDKATLEAADANQVERLEALESVTYEAIPVATIQGLFA